jgi:hypothetical protein
MAIRTRIALIRLPHPVRSHGLTFVHTSDRTTPELPDSIEKAGRAEDRAASATGFRMRFTQLTTTVRALRAGRS